MVESRKIATLPSWEKKQFRSTTLVPAPMQMVAWDCKASTKLHCTLDLHILYWWVKQKQQKARIRKRVQRNMKRPILSPHSFTGDWLGCEPGNGYGYCARNSIAGPWACNSRSTLNVQYRYNNPFLPYQADEWQSILSTNKFFEHLTTLWVGSVSSREKNDPFWLTTRIAATMRREVYWDCPFSLVQQKSW